MTEILENMVDYNIILPHGRTPSDLWGGGEKDLISIIVPVYNAGKYIAKCIESVLAQTYEHIEIILVDDGSNDNSLEQCRKFAALDSRIRVFHKENGGVASARNVGLSFAKGEYIGFVDSDDYIDSDMFKRLHDQLLQQTYDCVMCEHIKENNDGAEKETVIFEGNHDNVSSEYACAGICIPIGKDYTDVRYFYLWDKLYKREIWRNIRFDETLRNAEDRWALFQLYRNIDGIGLLHNALYFYQVHESTSSSANRNRDCDYDVGYRMLSTIEKSGQNISPYLETCVMHSLGRARSAAKKKDRDKYWDTYKKFRTLFTKAKKQIIHAKRKNMLAAVGFRFFPNVFYWMIAKV